MARINKCIELLEQGQPVYASQPPELSYDAGRDLVSTWADLLVVDFEHEPFDVQGLNQLIRGLRDGGPTPSGHMTPTVIATLPSNCTSAAEVLNNAWQARHVLTAGAHGILHTHARDPEAVQAFVATARYPFQRLGRDILPEGLRGAGGQAKPAEIWSLDPLEYVKRADPWPLNPQGELLLGLKIEDRHCLSRAHASALVPGISFAEWGPGDMGMSFGDPDAHDPPYSEIMNNARNTVKASCDNAGIAFYSSWNDPSMTDTEIVEYAINQLGAKIINAPNGSFADHGRKITGRTMPF